MTSHSIRLRHKVTVPSLGNCSGVVKYLGPVVSKEGTWVGVYLSEPKGDCSGIYRKRRYFSCRPNYGVFLPISKVLPLVKKAKKSKTTLEAGDGKKTTTTETEIKHSLEIPTPTPIRSNSGPTRSGVNSFRRQTLSVSQFSKLSNSKKARDPSHSKKLSFEMPTSSSSSKIKTRESLTPSMFGTSHSKSHSKSQDLADLATKSKNSKRRKSLAPVIGKTKSNSLDHFTKGIAVSEQSKTTKLSHNTKSVDSESKSVDSSKSPSLQEIQVSTPKSKVPVVSDIPFGTADSAVIIPMTSSTQTTTESSIPVAFDSVNDIKNIPNPEQIQYQKSPQSFPNKFLKSPKKKNSHHHKSKSTPMVNQSKTTLISTKLPDPKPKINRMKRVISDTNSHIKKLIGERSALAENFNSLWKYPSSSLVEESMIQSSKLQIQNVHLIEALQQSLVFLKSRQISHNLQLSNSIQETNVKFTMVIEHLVSSILSFDSFLVNITKSTRSASKSSSTLNSKMIQLVQQLNTFSSLFSTIIAEMKLDNDIDIDVDVDYQVHLRPFVLHDTLAPKSASESKVQLSLAQLEVHDSLVLAKYQLEKKIAENQHLAQTSVNLSSQIAILTPLQSKIDTLQQKIKKLEQENNNQQSRIESLCLLDSVSTWQQSTNDSMILSDPATRAYQLFQALKSLKTLYVAKTAAYKLQIDTLLGKLKSIEIENAKKSSSIDVDNSDVGGVHNNNIKNNIKNNPRDSLQNDTVKEQLLILEKEQISYKQTFQTLSLVWEKLLSSVAIFLQKTEARNSSIIDKLKKSAKRLSIMNSLILSLRTTVERQNLIIETFERNNPSPKPSSCCCSPWNICVDTFLAQYSTRATSFKTLNQSKTMSSPPSLQNINNTPTSITIPCFSTEKLFGSIFISLFTDKPWQSPELEFFSTLFISSIKLEEQLKTLFFPFHTNTPPFSFSPRPFNLSTISDIRNQISITINPLISAISNFKNKLQPQTSEGGSSESESEDSSLSQSLLFNPQGESEWDFFGFDSKALFLIHSFFTEFKSFSSIMTNKVAQFSFPLELAPKTQTSTSNQVVETQQNQIVLLLTLVESIISLRHPVYTQIKEGNQSKPPKDNSEQEKELVSVLLFDVSNILLLSILITPLEKSTTFTSFVSTIESLLQRFSNPTAEFCTDLSRFVQSVSSQALLALKDREPLLHSIQYLALSLWFGFSTSTIKFPSLFPLLLYGEYSPISLDTNAKCLKFGKYLYSKME